MHLKCLINPYFRFRTFLFLTASALLSFSCDKDSAPGNGKVFRNFQAYTSILPQYRTMTNASFFGEKHDDPDITKNATNVWMYDLKQNVWSPDNPTTAPP